MWYFLALRAKLSTYTVKIPLTNGAMPLVVLFEDGELVKEYDYISIDENEIASFFDDQR